MMTKDEEIIHLMKHTNTQEKGLRMMMDTYKNRLYWHIQRLISSEDISKDVLQETFIKAYQNFSKFKGESKLYAWLYKIASNEALQELNKIKKIPKIDTSHTEVYLENEMADSKGKDAEEIEVLLQNAIQKLPEKQRLVFTLRYYDDLPYEEISKILDMSIGTLKTNYHYAKEKIEEYVIKHSDDFNK